MPVTKRIELYVAAALSELNKLAEVDQKIGSARVYIKSADKVFGTANDLYDAGDEEKAYVLYMKYFNIIALVKKSADYKKQMKYYNELIGPKNCMTAINRAEELSKSLKARYELLADINRERVGETNVAPVNATADSSRKEPVSNGTTTPDAEKTDPPEEQKHDEDVPPGAVSAKRVYDWLRPNQSQRVGQSSQLTNRTNDQSVLLIDLRPVDEFEDSHITDAAVINIPADIVPPGKLIKHFEGKIAEKYKSKWAARGSVTHVVLFDWKSTIDDVKAGTPICSLKDAMYKWDRNTMKHEPLVLEGGYETWLFYYPTLTTNARPKITQQTHTQKLMKTSALDFDYPDFDEAFLDKPVQPELRSADPPNNRNNLMKASLVVDRSLKPKLQTDTHREPVRDDRTLPRQSVSYDETNLDKFIGAKPRIDRSLKPKIQSKSMDDLPDLQKVRSELLELKSLREEKADEFKKEMMEKEEKIQEQEKIIKNLQNEEKKLEELQGKRAKEEKDLADLMRKKRGVEEEIKKEKLNLEEQKRNQIVNEKEKQEFLDKLEEEKVKLETELTNQEPLPESPVAPETQRPLVDREVKPDVRAPDTSSQQLPDEKAYSPQNIASSDLANKPATPNQTSADSKPVSVQETGDLVEKSLKASLDSDKKLSEPEQRSSSPGLPVGWEKILDSKTQRYYYKDHNSKTTTWDPPGKKGKPDSTKSYTKLKDEPQTPSSGGMRRSSSTPNIARLADDEIPDHSKTSGRSQPAAQPRVDRASKPSLPDPRRQSLTDFQADRLMTMQPQYGSVEGGLTGLRNLGNTCYMNSIIQALNNTTPLVTYFLTGNYIYHINRDNFLGHGGDIPEELAIVVRALWSGKYTNFSPIDFKRTTGKHNPQFSGYGQQDSQEFLLFLLDGLHEDLNTVVNRPKIPPQDNDNLADYRAADLAWENHKRLNDSIIVELFQGQYKSTLTCLSCRKTSVTFDTFMYLSLPIPSSTRCSLQDCLQHFLKEEKMTGASKWFCPRCKQRREAYKKIDLWKLPTILLIHLKRFSCDGAFGQKLNTNVSFPLNNLNMREYIKGTKLRPDYNLYAVSNHYGTMQGGHYTAYCKNPVMKRWCKFDDSDVYHMSENDVKSSAAYILFYTSIEMTPPVI